MPKATPLVLVATMLALGVLIEAVGFGAVAWIPKVPLALLLLFAFARSRFGPARA